MCSSHKRNVYLMNVAKFFQPQEAKYWTINLKLHMSVGNMFLDGTPKPFFQISFPVCSEEWPKLNTNITKFKIQTLVICPIKMYRNIKKRALECYPKTCFWHKCEVSDWLFNFLTSWGRKHFDHVFSDNFTTFSHYFPIISSLLRKRV